MNLNKSALRILLSLFGFGLLPTLVMADRPNFVFIIADDCTYWDMECYGGQAKTPNLNKLCKQGIKFTRCFQQAPMCSPTRHAIYTALYPVKSGAYPNHTFAKKGTESIAHFLQRAGYRVGLSGKRHINPAESFPFEQLNGKGKKKDRNNPDFVAIKKFFKECKKQDKSFCLFACSNEPHTPWNRGDASQYPPGKLKLPSFFVDTPLTRENYSKYLAEITYYDWQVGQILQLLDELELSENTLVMVVSEQGNSFPFAKWTCYDMGLQSAMIVRWPGQVQAHSETDAMVEYVDIVPTFLDAAGVQQPAGLDGKSFLAVLKGKKTTHKDYCFGLQTTRGIINGSPHYGIRTVRDKQYRYIRNLTPDAKFQNVVLRAKWWKTWEEKAAAGDAHAQEMVKRYQIRPEEELYDTTNDPYNQKNLAADPKYAKVKRELRAQLDAWMQAQGDSGQETELQAFAHQWGKRKKK